MELLKRAKSYKPTITDIISLEQPLNTVVSPDGCKIAYTVQTTDWEKNQFETYCYVYDVEQERSYQLTQTGAVIQAHWIDDNSLALLKTDPSVRINPQVWVYENFKGKGIQITDHKTGVQSFKPFAGSILFLADNPEKREKRLIQTNMDLSFISNKKKAHLLYIIPISKK